MGTEVRGVPEAPALTEAAGPDASAEGAELREPQTDWDASIGRYLGRQRQLREISMEELASTTKIPRRSLERLEAGAFDDDTDGFARGFVRTVAEALGLDPDEAVMRLLREPPEDEGEAGALWLRAAQGALALSVIVVAVAAFGWLLGPPGAPDPVAAPEPALPSAALVYRRDAVQELARARLGGRSGEIVEVGPTAVAPGKPAAVAALPPNGEAVARLRTRALMLRSVDFGESDRILHLLLPDTGRITAIAKGAKRSVKRFSGALDLFNLLRVDIDRRRPHSMARLDQASVIGHFPSLRVDPARFALGCYLLELLDRMAPEGGARPDMQRLFAFAEAALGMIAARRPDDRLRTLLELRALDALGLRPELLRCVRCGTEPEEATLGFHVGDGGPVCAGCRGPGDGLVPVHRGTLRSLDRGLRFEIAQLDRLVLGGPALEEARSIVSRFRHFHVGIPLKSEAFLDRVLSDPADSPN